jgi:thioesterase domain-containing protein
VEELRSVHPDGPYFIGGFCFGGLLALEAARLLTAAGQEVPLLFLIQSIHPQSMRFKASTTPWQRLWYRTSKRVDLELQNLSHRGVNYFADRLQFTFNHFQAKTAFALGKVNIDGDADLSHFPTHYILEALAIEHSKAASKYVPRPYDGAVVLFRASKQLCGLDADEYLGWRQTLRGNLDVIDIAGHQQNLLLNPHVSLLAKELSRRLDAALRERVS